MEKAVLSKYDNFDHNSDVDKERAKRNIVCHKESSKKSDDAADRHDPVH